MTGKTEILTQWYDQVWQQGNPDAIAHLFRQDATARGLMPNLALKTQDFQEFVTAMLEVIRPPKVQILHCVEQGDLLAALVRFETQTVDRSRNITTAGSVFVRFDERTMVEAYNTMDFLGMLEQIGTVPQNTLALALTGARLS